MLQKASDTNTFNYAPLIGVVLLAIALVFVWRSFYSMRIPKEDLGARKLPEGEAASEVVKVH